MEGSSPRRMVRIRLFYTCAINSETRRDGDARWLATAVAM